MDRLRIFDITNQFLKITKSKYEFRSTGINKIQPDLKFEFIIDERKLVDFFRTTYIQLAIIEKYLDKNKDIKIKFLAIYASETSKESILVFKESTENRTIQVKEQVLDIESVRVIKSVEYLDTYFVYNPYRLRLNLGVDGALSNTIFKYLEEYCN